MKINKYPDGSSYVSVDGTDTNIIFKINTYQELWYLNQYVDAMNSKGIKPVVTIPNLLDAQADRRFNIGESSGLKLVCKFLNSMDATFIILHPHNPEVVEALLDDVLILDNSKFIMEVISSLELYHGKPETNHRYVDDTILMSADAGGFKSLMKLAEKIKWPGEVYAASKSRTFKQGTSILKQEVDRKDFKGKDIVIVDDISVRGGTFKGLAKILAERNIGGLYLAVTHMTVQNLGEDPVTDYFDEVFTTDSKFEIYNIDIPLKDTTRKAHIGTPHNLNILSI